MNPDYMIRGRNQIAFSEQSDRSITTENNVAAATQASGVISRSDNETNKVFERRASGPQAQQADLTFEDFLDTINPLQHIPVINTLYREMTGDKISGIAQVAGGALYGGAMGLVSGIVSAIVQEETGKDIGETALAALTGDKKPTIPSATPGPTTTMLAQAKPQETKQPFGGVMASATPSEENQVHDNQEEVAVAAAAPIVPMAAAPVAALSGQKFFSLSKVPRVASNDLGNMPVKDVPDVRLKPLNRQAIGIAKADSSTGIPLTHKDDAIKALGLAAPDTALAQSAAAQGAMQGSQPIPKELIQDMMLMNMQKYQDGLKDGTLRGSLADVNG